jgi:hypothetical protein
MYFVWFLDSLSNNINCIVSTFKYCDKNRKKSTNDLESQTPPYLPNGDRLGEFFCSIMFRNLINEGVGHLQIPKRNPQLGQNAHVTKKFQIFNILQTSHF